MSATKAVKLNFLVEAGVSRELHELVPAGQRSKVVNAAIKRELLRLKRRMATEKLLELRAQGPGVTMDEIVAAINADRSR